MRTINQINSRIKRNDVIKMYLRLSSIRHSSEETDWRNKSYKFISGRGGVTNLTVTGNFIFGQAMKEFAHILGLDRYKSPKYFETTRSGFIDMSFENRRIDFTLMARIDFNGVSCSVETNFAPMARGFKFDIKSNDSFDRFDLEAYFKEKILPKYLFADGVFRRVQIYFNCDKKTAIQKYKDLLEKAKREVHEVDLEKAWSKLLKKKRNILSNGYGIDTIKKAYNKFPYQKKRKTLQRLDYSRLLIDFDGDIDELEGLLYEELNDYPDNTLFI